MGFIKTKGIVIREVNTGEADKIITIFTRSNGKISCYSKNARRPKNRAAAATQLLCYSEFVLFKGKDLFSLSSCDIIEPFYEIRNDIIKLTHAAHYVDLINDIIQENQTATKVLQLFLNTLHMLSKTDKSPDLLTRIFEMRILSLLGYAPHVRCCVECGSDELQAVSFSFKKCGFICKDCRTKDEVASKLSLGAAKAIHHIVHSPIKDLFSFNLSDEVLFELEKINKKYLKDRLDREYRKLDFLKNL